MNHEVSFTDRVEGCLLGLFLGDAMGTPLRSVKAGHIQQVYGEVGDFVDQEQLYKDRPGRWTPQGLHSYTAQLSLITSEAVMTSETPGGEFVSLLSRFASESGSPYGLLRGVSQELKPVLRRLKGDESHSSGETLEATSAIALVPLGIHSAVVHAPLPMKQAAEIAMSLSPDIRSVTSALVLAHAIAEILHGHYDSAQSARVGIGLLSEYANEVETYLSSAYPQLVTNDPQIDASVSSTLAILPGLLAEHKDEWARQSITAESSRHFPLHPFDDPQFPFAPANLAWALYLTFRERRFDVPVLHALQSGRETNIVAALCGALAGARLGKGAIPPEWPTQLIAKEIITSRVEALIEENPAPLYDIDLFEAESDWTRMEEEGRRKRFRQLEDEQKKRQEKQEKKKPRTAVSPLQPPPSTYARKDRSFAPPPSLEIDPEEARKLKALRAKKKIDWKEERRKGQREK